MHSRKLKKKKDRIQDDYKEMADYITESNDEDGIVNVIDKFMTPKLEKEDTSKEETKAMPEN